MEEEEEEEVGMRWYLGTDLVHCILYLTVNLVVTVLKPLTVARKKVRLDAIKV